MVIIVAIPTGLDGHNGHQINCDYYFISNNRNTISFILYLHVQLLMIGAILHSAKFSQGTMSYRIESNFEGPEKLKNRIFDFAFSYDTYQSHCA